MLFKDLKEIIKEADEATEETPIDGETPAQSEKEKPTKPEAAKKAVKDATDGVGNEVYDVAAELAEFLGKALPSTYPDLREVEAEKGMVIIKGGAKYLHKKGEEFTNVVQEYVIASLGTEEMKKIKLNGPFIANNDANISIKTAEVK